MCKHCRGQLLWWDDQILYPELSIAPPPNADLEQDIQADYNEAASVVNKSPRSAAALLRQCIQKLNVQLGQPGKKINADIAALVDQGLAVEIQEALDSVRVIGNHSVHPGTIDIKDDAKTAGYLFELVNFIAEQMITQPKQRSEFYATKLPQAERDRIAERDAKKAPTAPAKPSS